MKLLFVASDAREFSGILNRAGDARRVAMAVDWARSAKLAGHEALLVANGVGVKQASTAVDRAAAFGAEAVISTGFCGALDKGLDVADVVVADSVVCGSKLWRTGYIHRGDAENAEEKHAEETQSQNLRPRRERRFGALARSGAVYCSDHIIQSAEEKRKLAATGACAVEMEAAGVAERAAALGVPFYCVKAVTDLANETLANEFAAALRPDGHFATMLLLRRSLHHPIERIPELLRLRNRCARAARALGDFFVECRF